MSPPPDWLAALERLPEFSPGFLAAAGYAEFHYKFKLPWSPLFKREPELIADAPYAVKKGGAAPLFLVTRDGDRFPIRLLSVEIDLRKEGGLCSLRKFEPNEVIDTPFRTLEFPLDLPEEPGLYRVNVKIDWEPLRNGKPGRRKTAINSNLPTLPPIPLEITRLGADSPIPGEWKGGDLHTHTTATSSPVEFGGEPEMMQRAAAAIGLDWFGCTDHSYDFRYRSDRYQVPTDPQEKRNELLRRLEGLDPEGPLAVPGEEVSAGNWLGQNVHLLVLGNRHHIEGNGDGGRRWFNNRPDLTIPEVIEQAEGLPCWAAHPRVTIPKLEKMVFRRGIWHPEDLRPGLSGLQFWNGGTGTDFLNGRAFWVRRLLQGERWLPGGGTDAHGDLNRNTAVKTPLFSLRQHREQRMGSVRTWIPLPGKTTLDGVLRGLSEGGTLVGNGPWIGLERELSGAVRVTGRSSADFGPIRRMVIFSGLKGAISEMSQAVDPHEGKGNLSFETELRVELPPDARYLRAEIFTTAGNRALTSPVWLDD